MKAVSGRELCRALERAGWVLVRVRGSHRRYERPDSAPITVPVHANETLKVKLQHVIMKAAGLTEADL